uniref:Uncharacterized protein n=1 Tax=viral metagenome TaxID=1070528 RepID=A0A6C0ACW8_9ZZZZ
MDVNRTLFNYVRDQEWEKLLEVLKKNDDIDVNIRDNNGNYLITYAVLFNKIDVVSQLIHSGAKLDVTDNDNRSILYTAVKYGYKKVLELLLHFNKTTVGISLVDIQDVNNNIPIHYAISSKEYDICKILIDHGSNLNIKDINGNTSLHLAIYSRDLEICKLILEHTTKINSKNNAGETPLHLSCNLELLDIIEFLLKNGADVDPKDYEYEYTPLLYAVSRGNSSISALLLKYDANPNHQDFYGNSSLHFAILENNTEIFLQLTESKYSKNKVNFNLYNADSKLPLHLAIEKKNSRYIDILIEKSNLNIQDSEGNSPLHLLAKTSLWIQYKNKIKTSKMNIFLKNKNNKTVLDYIDKEDYREFIDLIVESYLYRLRNKPYTWNSSWENICKKEVFADKISSKELKEFEKIINTKNKEDLCKSVVTKKILDIATNKLNPKKEKSFPEKQGYVHLDLDNNNSLEFCTFTGITLDILIGLIVVLNKHKTATSTLTPNFVTNTNLCDFYKQLGVVSDTNCEFLNFELIWVYHKLYLSDDFFNQFRKKMNKPNKRFIIIPLGIELREGSHANYLIYDNQLKQIERFEPYGSQAPQGFNYNPSLLDSILMNRFESVFDIKYVSPDDYLPKIGFQVFESYENMCIKIGDPKGFCALWALWYTDMRMKYPDLDRKILVKEIFKTVKEENRSFKNLIRNYSSNVIKKRDAILQKANININDWLNDKYTTSQMKIIINILREEIQKLG